MIILLLCEPQIVMYYLHRRTGQHPLGVGQIEFCPNGFGGIIFSRPIRWGGVVAELFPLTAVTDPKFVLFKHVLCFARIISTLCPNVCLQTARIGGNMLVAHTIHKCSIV